MADDIDSVEELLMEAEDTLDGEGGSEEKQRPPIEWAEDALNLVRMLKGAEGGPEKLRELRQTILGYFDAAWESGEQHREMEANNWKLFTGDLPPKMAPFKDCANFHVPIALENISRLWLRAHGEIFGDGRDVFSVEPIGPDDVETAETISIHDNWQLSEKIPDFQRQMFRSQLMFYFHGDTVLESYWSEEYHENRHEALTQDEFVAPYTHVSTMPDLSDCPHYFRVRRMYRNQLQSKQQAWEDVDVVLGQSPPEAGDEPDSPMERSNAETNQIEPPSIEDSYSGTYTILQFEGWLSLDDGKPDRWCQAFVDKQTETVLQLRIHEEPSWEDKARYEAQTLELETYIRALDVYVQALDELEQKKAVVEAGGAPPEAAMAVQQGIKMMPAPPAPPSWVDTDEESPRPAPMRRVPIRMFTHAVCLENLTGMQGLSYGRIQADLNRAANIAMNQFIDAGSFANGGMIMMPGGVELEHPVAFAPGKIIKLSGVLGSDLSKSVLPLKFPPASGQLREMVDLAQRLAASSIQAPGLLSGEPGKSGETYRGLSARLEQAQKQLSVSAQAFCNQALVNVLRNNARLNAVFMPEERVQYLMNHKVNERSEYTLRRGMWQRRYSVRFRADLRFSTTAMKIGEADELLQMPEVIRRQMGPAGEMADLSAFTHQAAVEALRARNRPDLIPALGPRPEPPQTALGMPLVAPPGPPPLPWGPPSPTGPPGSP